MTPPSGAGAWGDQHLEAAVADAGLSPVTIDQVVLREEAGRPVPGWLVAARLPARPQG